MRAARFHAPRDVRVERVPVPAPRSRRGAAARARRHHLRHRPQGLPARAPIAAGTTTSPVRPRVRGRGGRRRPRRYPWALGQRVVGAHLRPAAPAPIALAARRACASGWRSGMVPTLSMPSCRRRSSHATSTRSLRTSRPLRRRSASRWRAPYTPLTMPACVRATPWRSLAAGRWACCCWPRHVGQVRGWCSAAGGRSAWIRRVAGAPLWSWIPRQPARAMSRPAPFATRPLAAAAPMSSSRRWAGPRSGPPPWRRLGLAARWTSSAGAPTAPP